MDDIYAEKIETMLEEYYNYRSIKENNYSMQSVSNSNNAHQRADFEWLPDPLELKPGVNISNNIANAQVSAGDYSRALSDNVAKKLEPYVKSEIDKVDYEQSPIYDDLDKETIAQMTDKAYNEAIQHIPELGDLEAVDTNNRAYYNKGQIVRSLIRELILKDIYLYRRLKKYS